VKARLPFAISWKWLGQVVALLAASVTERRQARSALWQVEERFRLLVESAKGYAIYMLDAEGRIATWSAEAARIKGYRAEEIIGKSFHTFFTPEDIQGGVPEQVLRTAREEGRARYEGWRVRKDGSRFCVEGVITAIRDESGALNGYSNVAHDVTDRKRAEEALRQSETRFRTLSEGRRNWSGRPCPTGAAITSARSGCAIPAFPRRRSSVSAGSRRLIPMIASGRRPRGRGPSRRTRRWTSSSVSAVPTARIAGSRRAPCRCATLKAAS